jgi:hypothetical protein
MLKKFFEFAQFSQSQFEPIKSFYLQNELNPEVWTNFKIDEDIRENLLTIANDFIDSIELEGIEIKDIIFTGSLTNYNWSKYSDFDLHVIIDFSEISDNFELVERMFDYSKKYWNLQHELKIAGYDVELAAQDVDDLEEGMTSGRMGGIFSLKDNKWLKKPSKVDFVPDEDKIRKKASTFMREIKEIESVLESDADLEELSGRIKKVWNKIKDGRKAGLAKEGEYSIENLVFKLLRRNGYIQRVVDAKRKAYDKRYK